MSIWVKKFESSDAVSVAIKDSIDIAGSVTGLGSRVTNDQPQAVSNADVILKLKQAGFHIAGKVNMHELAFGMTGVNDYTGTPENPLFPAYITGGSSSGSAAVVADKHTPLALGTDTGGSVRVPASCCGVYGFKPTFGRVSRQGVWPAQSSLDCVGGFASELNDLAKLHSILDEDLDWQAEGTVIENLAIAYYPGQCDEVVNKTITTVLEQANIEFTVIDIPYFDEAFDAAMTLISYETYQACKDIANSDALGADVKTRLQIAQSVTEQQVQQAEAIRMAFTQAFDSKLNDFPVVIMPGLPHAPLKRDEALAGKQDLNISRFARPFNLSGHPALVMPIDIQADWPCSLQLVAGKNQDVDLFNAAKQFVERLKSI